LFWYSFKTPLFRSNFLLPQTTLYVFINTHPCLAMWMMLMFWYTYIWLKTYQNINVLRAFYPRPVTSAQMLRYRNYSRKIMQSIRSCVNCATKCKLCIRNSCRSSLTVLFPTELRKLAQSLDRAQNVICLQLFPVHTSNSINFFSMPVCVLEINMLKTYGANYGPRRYTLKDSIK